MGSGIIYLDALQNYANQYIPSYITLDNTVENHITDEVATLGRVLFYDKQLSLDNGTSCASCHQQDVAFGDRDQVSLGSFGITGRHSMRLVNARFSAEQHFFWDERAATLEEQTTMPIQDPVEMGYSGQFGDPDFDGLITKLNDIDYYDILFEFAFGDSEITEERIQLALGQFVRSIQSFDTRYDEGRLMVDNDTMPFPNFTAEENLGKKLFIESIQFGDEGNRIGGGLACANCHVPPEFSINPNSRTNGVFLAANGVEFDEGISRSPTLRDVFNPQGELNGPLMHNGLFTDMRQVLEHYNDIQESTGMENPFVDTRLKNGQFIQKLNMTDEEFDGVIAFFKTLTGTDLYTNEKWSDPFGPAGELQVLDNSTSTNDIAELNISISPNPASGQIKIENLENVFQIDILSSDGQALLSRTKTDNATQIIEDISGLNAGIYFVVARNKSGNEWRAQKLIKI